LLTVTNDNKLSGTVISDKGGINCGAICIQDYSNGSVVTLSATAEGKFLPQPGAVLIKDANGNVLGAVGASGGTGDEDEIICKAGVKACGLITD
jgi:uncharacterized protein GlcG (DUF336 family)